MRGYLINSERQTIEEIDVGPGLDDVYRLLNCRKIANCSRNLRGNMTEGFDAIYASDDYREDRDNPRFWFQVDTDRTPPSSFPVAGNGLVHGVDPEAPGATSRSHSTKCALASRSHAGSLAALK